ncbi:hypothetical protein HGA88_05015 [Candidatus Roizmanbacteria bacterium]|nr:hypothetical protein [Candidatus Roizmanbacteria bacterium]
MNSVSGGLTIADTEFISQVQRQLLIRAERNFLNRRPDGVVVMWEKLTTAYPEKVLSFKSFNKRQVGFTKMLWLYYDYICQQRLKKDPYAFTYAVRENKLLSPTKIKAIHHYAKGVEQHAVENIPGLAKEVLCSLFPDRVAPELFPES